MRHYSGFDQVISLIDNKLFQRKNLQEKERQLSISLMRINHSGEVCAQALYQGQAFVTRNKDLENKLKEAAFEEETHLKWCQDRIEALGGKTSLFNPLWHLGSLCIGALAGLAGDKVSLGFIAETEHQVTRHLEKHLELLPENDKNSREILLKMKEDELRHATNAEKEGGIPLPTFIQKMMKMTAKIMTTTTKYL